MWYNLNAQQFVGLVDPPRVYTIYMVEKIRLTSIKIKTNLKPNSDSIDES